MFPNSAPCCIGVYVCLEGSSGVFYGSLCRDGFRRREM